MDDDFDIAKNTKAKADVWPHFKLKIRKSDYPIVAAVMVCFGKGGGGGGGRTRNLVISHKTLSSPPVRTFVTKFIVPAPMFSAAFWKSSKPQHCP